MGVYCLSLKSAIGYLRPLAEVCFGPALAVLKGSRIRPNQSASDHKTGNDSGYVLAYCALKKHGGFVIYSL